MAAPRTDIDQPVNVISNASKSAPDPMALARQGAELHLFGDVAAKPVEETRPQPVQPKQETTLNLKLAGAFAYEPKERAIAIISVDNGDQTAFGVGDKITGNVTLTEVFSDYVVISNRGKSEILRLPENVAPVAMRPIQSASAETRRGNNSGQISEDPNQPVTLPTSPGELRDTLARNPALLGRVVAAEPYQENGKLLGYRITPKQNPEILEAQGIVAGDIITRVNNIQLNSQKQGIRALRNAVKADNLSVVVLRGGVEVPINISLANWSTLVHRVACRLGSLMTPYWVGYASI